RAGIERPPAGDVEPEPLERGVELLPAPSHEARQRTDELHGLRGVDHARRLGRDGAGDPDAPGRDVALSALTRRREAAAYELGVETAARATRLPVARAPEPEPEPV